MVSNAILKPIAYSWDSVQAAVKSVLLQGQVTLHSPCYTYSDFFILSTPSLLPSACWMWTPWQLS